MILPVKQTFLLATTLMLAFNCPGFAQPSGKTTASSTHATLTDINKAQIAGQKPHPEILASDVASIGIAIETPLPVEIPAIDNLINLNASAGRNLTASFSALPDFAASTAQAMQKIYGAMPVASAAGIQNLPVASEPLSAQQASGTPIQTITTASRSSEFIDTLYPDPLSPDFPANNTISGSEKNRPADELIEEFNRKAEEIAARTAAELGSAAAILETGSAKKNASDTAKAVKTMQSADKNIIKDPAALGQPMINASQTTSGSATDTSAVDAYKDNFLASNSEKLPDQQPVEPVSMVDREDVASDSVAIDGKPLPEVVVEGNEINEMPATEQVVNQEEIIPVSWPDSDEDPEFASGSPRLQNTASSTDDASQGLFEKAEALEPALMTMGKPEDDQSDINENQKLSGTIVPEKQPLGRRKHLYRWVLKTDDGNRIPLKSNLKLLTEVRRENILDGKVTLNGRFVKSPLNKELRYFVVDSATISDRAAASDTADIKGKGGVASGSVKLKK